MYCTNICDSCGKKVIGIIYVCFKFNMSVCPNCHSSKKLEMVFKNIPDFLRKRELYPSYPLKSKI